MAFAQVAAEAGTDSAANTTHTVNLPTGIVAGSLLLVALAGDANPSIGFPADWTEIKDVAGFGSAVRMGCAYRFADGLEGSSIAVTFTTSDECAARAFRFTGHHASTAPEISASVGAQNANPDPDALNPAGWDVEDTLWIAFCVFDTAPTISAYPTDYTNGVRDVGVAAVGMGTARRERAAASEDPGTFTISVSNQQWQAATIAVRPAAAAAAGSLVLPNPLLSMGIRKWEHN